MTKKMMVASGGALTLILMLGLVQARAQSPETAAAPRLLPGRAFHVLPATHNNESGYFGLVEGNNGKLYVGTAKYGENAYLVELDPKTGRQRIVIDTAKLTGSTGKGFASQSKIHTKNFVGPSGKVYVGSKEGYPSEEEKKKNDVSPYAGGFVMTYDPATDKAENLGMPYPGQGVGDVIADEGRGLLYIVTCEDEYWMIYNTRTRRFRWLGTQCFEYASTLVDNQGRANTLASNYQMARWDPATNTLTQQDILVDGKKLAPATWEERTGWIPSWVISPDRKTAWLIRMSHPELYKLDLTGDINKPVTGTVVAKMLDREVTDCRSALSLGPDGRIYAAIAEINKSGLGKAYELTHLARFDPATGKSSDLGVMTVQNPDFFNFKGKEGKAPPFSHGILPLDNGQMVPQYQPLAGIVSRDGSAYTMFLYPFTILQHKDATKLP